MFHLDDKETDAIREGTWELTCLSMELKRPDGKHSFAGSGIIRQDEQRRLRFKLIDREHAQGWKEFFEESSNPRTGLRAGQIIPREHYYVLTAIDGGGRQWTSEPFVDVNQKYGGGNGVVVEGLLREVRFQRDVSGAVSAIANAKGKPVDVLYEHLRISYQVFTEIGRFPCNTGMETKEFVDKREVRSSSSMCVAKDQSDEFEFELLKTDNGVTFTVDAKKPGGTYSNRPEQRFAEAMQFVLGRPFEWEILEIALGNQEEVRIRPRPKGKANIHMLPPVQFDLHQHFTEFWSLFKKYLNHVWPYADEGWHPVSRRILTFQHGSAGLWPIRMLTAGVEVEGLVKDQYKDLNVSATEEVAQTVESVLGLIDGATKNGAPLDVGTLERIKNSLGRLKSASSIKDKLYALASQSVVRLDDVDAWAHVRNKATHAVASETEMSQENFVRWDKVLVLFYHLIFNLIGHTGAYTDYGEFGFPTKQYPPVPAEKP